MPSRNSYSRLISNQIFLTIYLVLLSVITLIMPDTKVPGGVVVDIPLLAGLIDIGDIPVYLSSSLAILLLMGMLFSLYCVAVDTFLSYQKALFFSLLYAIIALVNRSVLSLSGDMAAAILLVWSLYFSSMGREEERDLFLSSFLISVATLFCPCLVALIPLIVYFSMLSTSFKVKNFAISLSAVLLPYFFLFSLRYLFFEDAAVFGVLLITEISNLSALPLRISSLPEIILVLLLAIASINATLSMLTTISRYKSKESSILGRMVFLLILLLLLNIAYPRTFGSFMPYLSIPLSFLIGDYMTSDNRRFKNRGVELFLFFIMLVVCKIVLILGN